MIDRETLIEYEKVIQRFKKVTVAFATHDNENTSSKVEIVCPDCKKKSRYGIYRESPISVLLGKCPVCRKINCMCFLNTVLN